MKNPRLSQFVKKHINSENIKILFLFIPLSLLLIKQIKAGAITFEDYFDPSILVSFLIAFLCETIASSISKKVNHKLEDVTKLTEDYDKLISKYNLENLLEYCDKKFPIVELISRTLDSSPFNLAIDHSHMDIQYVLPDGVDKHYDWIMKAHSSSVIYNRWNIRLDDIYEKCGQVNLLYSTTMYYSSLATNRAMDFPLENGETIREMYEPGPYLSTLIASKLSNHLGFNGFIETSDRKFIFIVRGDYLSIGKNTLATSIGASLKTEYCLDAGRNFTLSALSEGIRKEIYDELKIRIDDDVDMCKSIFAFYRDLVEGGKPQFLFHYKVNNISVRDFQKKNIKWIEKDKKDQKQPKVDGTVFYFKSLDELKASKIYPGKIVFPDGTAYKMMPSASASVVMLLKYYRESI